MVYAYSKSEQGDLVLQKQLIEKLISRLDLSEPQTSVQANVPVQAQAQAQPA